MHKPIYHPEALQCISLYTTLRHYAAFIVGLMPSICDWASNLGPQVGRVIVQYVVGLEPELELGSGLKLMFELGVELGVDLGLGIGFRLGYKVGM